MAGVGQQRERACHHRHHDLEGEESDDQCERQLQPPLVRCRAGVDVGVGSAGQLAAQYGLAFPARAGASVAASAFGNVTLPGLPAEM